MYLRMRVCGVIVSGFVASLYFADVCLSADRAIGSTHYSLETKPVRRVKATLTTMVDAPNLVVREWVISAPAMPELPSQRDIVQSLSIKNARSRESSPLARELFTARLQTDSSRRSQHRLSLGAEYHVTLYSRRLIPVTAHQPGELSASAEELDRYVQSDRYVDYSHRVFQHWLAKRGLTKPSPDRVAFARDVFRAIRDDLHYSQREPLPTNASAAVSAREADCGGLSMIFVAALRANGTPARLVVGRWAESARREVGGMADQMHVKAEFYVDRIGWIPVDCSGAVEDRAAPDSEYFGNDAGDFLTFHVDCGLRVDTVHFGVEELVTLQDVAFWAKGDGSFRGITTSSDWRVSEEPLVDALAKHP
jgi:transglutaminase-like putative cysteine protease